MQEHKAVVMRFLAEKRAELLAYTCDLTATPSMNLPGNEQAMADAVLRRLDDLGLKGADYLVAERLVQADAAVLGEPAGIHKEWEHLCLISRGNCCSRIKVRGTQMHSSISDILPSVNASAKMAKVLERMQKELPHRIHFSPHLFCPQGPTLNVGVMVKGGVYFGVYPGYAEFSCDLRVLPGMTQEGVRLDS
jgi:acetylornithine deacetylase/succinyl-diaminopimelate desuccinylase-like protein